MLLAVTLGAVGITIWHQRPASRPPGEATSARLFDNLTPWADEILRDGDVSSDEIESAYSHLITCLTEGGIEVETVGPRRPSFVIATYDDTPELFQLDESCRGEVAPVESVWILLNAPTPSALKDLEKVFIECVSVATGEPIESFQEAAEIYNTLSVAAELVPALVACGSQYVESGTTPIPGIEQEYAEYLQRS